MGRLLVAGRTFQLGRGVAVGTCGALAEDCWLGHGRESNEPCLGPKWQEQKTKIYLMSERIQFRSPSPISSRKKASS